MLPAAIVQDARPLLVQEVQLGAGLLRHPALLDVAHDADDGERRRLAGPGEDVDPLADRLELAEREEGLLERLVHQQHRRARDVGRLEAAPLHDRNPHRLQVVHRDGLVVVDVLGRLIGRRRVALEVGVVGVTLRFGGRPVIRATPVTPGTCLSRSPSRSKNATRCSGFGYGGARQHHAEGEHPLAIEAGDRRSSASGSCECSSPAPTTRTTASATSAITRPLRMRARALPAVERCRLL